MKQGDKAQQHDEKARNADDGAAVEVVEEDGQCIVADVQEDRIGQTVGFPDPGQQETKKYRGDELQHIRVHEAEEQGRDQDGEAAAVAAELIEDQSPEEDFLEERCQQHAVEQHEEGQGLGARGGIGGIFQCIALTVQQGLQRIRQQAGHQLESVEEQQKPDKAAGTEALMGKLRRLGAQNQQGGELGQYRGQYHVQIGICEDVGAEAVEEAAALLEDQLIKEKGDGQLVEAELGPPFVVVQHCAFSLSG